MLNVSIRTPHAKGFFIYPKFTLIMLVKIDTPKGERMALVFHELEEMETALTFQRTIIELLQNADPEMFDANKLFDISHLLSCFSFQDYHLTKDCEGVRLPHLDELTDVRY